MSQMKTIAIVCSSPVHAKGRISEVALFGRGDKGWELYPWNRSGRIVRQVVSVENAEQVDVFDPANYERVSTEVMRYRYNLACNLCSANLTRRPSTRFHDVLDQFLDSGQNIVTLDELAAKLS